MKYIKETANLSFYYTLVDAALLELRVSLVLINVGRPVTRFHLGTNITGVLRVLTETF